MHLNAVRASLLISVSLLVACVGDPPASAPTGTEGGTGPDGATSDAAGPSTPDSSLPSDAGRDAADAGGDAATPICGTPGLACCAGSPCTGGALCDGVMCACPNGKTACGAACVDTQMDTANCGRCGHDCVGGACTAGQCKAYTVATGQSGARKIVVDSGRAFWARANSSTTGGGLFSAKLDGTDLKVHYQLPSGDSCAGLAVANGTAYFLCKNGAARDIRSCALPACTTISVTTPSVSASAGPVAADATTGRVFYAVGTPYGSTPNGTILESTGTAVGSANQANPYDIVFANGAVYWLNAGTYDSSSNALKNGGVYRASIGSLATQQLVLGTNGTYYDNTSLSVDAINAYYVGRNTSKSDVLVAPAAGGGTLTVFAQDLGVHEVVSDGTNVFFDDETSQTVRYCPRAAGCTGGTRSLVDGELQPRMLAVDAVSVLWINGQGVIRRVAKP